MPTGRAAREIQVVDPVLTNIARQYTPGGFIYGLLCPTIPVETLSSQYPVYDERYWYAADGDNKLSDRDETPEIELVWSLESFVCEDYGLKISFTPRERQQMRSSAGAALRIEKSKIRFLLKQMALRREIRLAAQLRKTTNGGQLALGAAATAPFVSSTAIESDWKGAITASYGVTGMVPNVAVVPYLKAYDMATNPTLREIFKYQINAENIIKIGTDSNGEDVILPRVFHGVRIIVPKGAMKQAGHEGAAKSLSEIWGSSARFLYVDENAGWGTPGTCYQFQHPVLSGDGRAAIPSDVTDGESGPVVDRFWQDDPKKEFVRAQECTDEKVCAPELGFELTGI